MTHVDRGIKAIRNDPEMQRMRADLQFGMRFMPRVTQAMAYKQALHVLYGPGGPVPYTPAEQADLDRRCVDQARRVLLGSLLDCFAGRLGE
jgi:hypothetical protein